MKLASVIAVAGIAAAASAQTVTYSWSVSDTGNGDGIIEPGESALLTMIATMDPGATGFAGSIYDIIGGMNWDTGSVDSYVNSLKDLTDDGTLQANGDITTIESFQLPPAFNGNFISDNPIELYNITWTPNDYSARTVEVGDANHLNNDVYTDDFGTSIPYAGVDGTASFSVVPAPASMALLGLGGLVATRRRR
ncbi:MAG: PEP-CTERM sorting domain-containing protein [Planctomycetota bacterium]|nr:PEP-CTERM sorting domain-containing protein [Planctomycetota bacterium]